MTSANFIPIRSGLAKVLAGLCFVWMFAILYFIIVGKPEPLLWGDFQLGWKTAQRGFKYLGMTFAAFLLVHPNRKAYLTRLESLLTSWGNGSTAIWILTGIYFLLFLAHSVSNYLALEINFLPFSFFDHMLHYLFQGKIHYTGMSLHEFYHVTSIVYLLAPLWLLWKSPLLLVLVHPLILSLAAIPLFYLARHILKNGMLALTIAFTYLNYRFLLNVLTMDFTAVAFYPVLVFSLIFFLTKKNWPLYFVFMFLTFLVKEDGPFYLACLGGFLLVFKKEYRMIGLATLALSISYELFILKALMPITGNPIAVGNARNYPQYLGANETPGEVFRYLITHPHMILKEYVVPPEKIKTFFKLLSKLLFIPLFSPWFLVVLGVVFPCFLQGGIDQNFMQLKYHYSAPTIAFLFIALIFGFSNLLNWFSQKTWQRWLILSLVLLLVTLNGGNYYRAKVTQDDMKSIELVKSLDKDKEFVITGHLFPYIGYKENSLYFSHPLDREDHPLRDWYMNPGYYVIDLGAKPYPFTLDEMRQKVEALKKRKDLKLTYEDHRRFVFEKIA